MIDDQSCALCAPGADLATLATAQANICTPCLEEIASASPDAGFLLAPRILEGAAQ